MPTLIPFFLPGFPIFRTTLCFSPHLFHTLGVSSLIDFFSAFFSLCFFFPSLWASYSKGFLNPFQFLNQPVLCSILSGAWNSQQRQLTWHNTKSRKSFLELKNQGVDIWVLIERPPGFAWLGLCSLRLIGFFQLRIFALVQGFVSSCQNSLTRFNLGMSFWHFLGYWEECDSLGILLFVRERRKINLRFSFYFGMILNPFYFYK